MNVFRIKENLKHSNRFYEAYKNIKDMSLYHDMVNKLYIYLSREFRSFNSSYSLEKNFLINLLKSQEEWTKEEDIILGTFKDFLVEGLGLFNDTLKDSLLVFDLDIDTPYPSEDFFLNNSSIKASYNIYLDRVKVYISRNGLINILKNVNRNKAKSEISSILTHELTHRQQNSSLLKNFFSPLDALGVMKKYNTSSNTYEGYLAHPFEVDAFARQFAFDLKEKNISLETFNSLLSEILSLTSIEKITETNPYAFLYPLLKIDQVGSYVLEEVDNEFKGISIYQFKGGTLIEKTSDSFENIIKRNLLTTLQGVLLNSESKERFDLNRKAQYDLFFRILENSLYNYLRKKGFEDISCEILSQYVVTLRKSQFMEVYSLNFQKRWKKFLKEIYDYTYNCEEDTLENFVKEYSPFHRFLNESHFLTNGCGVSKLKERIKESYEKGIREKIFERGYSFLCLITS